MAIAGGALAHASEISVEIVVTRASGKVERRGTVAHWHRSPLRRLLRALATALKKDMK